MWKLKLNLCLCITSRRLCGSGGKAPYILYLGIDGGEWLTLKSRPLYSRWKSARYPLGSELGGAHSGNENKNPWPCRESNPFRPDRSHSEPSRSQERKWVKADKTRNCKWLTVNNWCSSVFKLQGVCRWPCGGSRRVGTKKLNVF
jgi:hypothetical protein